MDPAHQIKSHEKTYGGFVGLLKWTVPVVAFLTLLVILVIA